jgi:ElaB/YqjD/DUF883 family membrane-anchored ribosome-binding protein
MSQPAYDVEPLDSFDEENTTREVDEVEVARSRVEQTRAEMADTIEAIKDKLNPEHLKEQAKETVREATIGRAQHAMEEVKDRARDAMENVADRTGDYTGTIMDTIRENPIPAAMIGIGIGWLLMSARKQNNGRRYDRYYSNGSRSYGYPDYQTTDRYENPAWSGRGTASYRAYDEPESEGMVGRVQERAGEMKERVQERAGDIAERAGEMKDRIQYRAGEVKDRLQERAGEMKERLQNRAGEMKDRVQEGTQQLGERARYQSRQAVTVVQQNMDENPLAVGAVALVVGAAVGFMLPETQKEREWMGETRDRVMDRAQSTAQQLGQKVQSVAREAVSTAKSAAQNEGLTPDGSAMDTLKQKVQNVAQTTVDAVKDAASDQGLTSGQAFGQQRAA